MDLTQDNLIEAVKSASAQKRKKIFEDCSAIAQAEDLRILEKPISFFALPFCVEAKAVDAACRKLDPFVSALLRLEEYALSDHGKNIFERLMASLTSWGQDFVRQCPTESVYSLNHRHRRIDGFLDPATGSYLINEVNQAAPQALAFHDTGQQIAAHALAELGFSFEPHYLAPHILDWLFGEYKNRFNGALPDTIALVIEHGFPTKFTELPAIGKACEKLALSKYGHPLKIIVCFPYEIKLCQGSMMLGEQRIDMIWRNSGWMISYKEQKLDLVDYEQICSNPDKFLLVNTIRTWLTRTKEVFAIFWDDAAMNEIGFSEFERKAVRQVVPFTVNLQRTPEMRQEASLAKDRWVSKPTDSDFGKGVQFGNAHSQASWEELLAERQQDGFVLQERIVYPVAGAINLAGDGSFEETRVEYDFCPHHIDGRFTGSALVRSRLVDACRPAGSLMILAAGGFLYPMARV
jgi:hypothetical protein